MNTWIRRSLQVGVLSAGLVLAGTAVAHAADLTSVGNAGIANGNQTYAPVQTVTNVCGNAIGVLGNAQAACTGGAEAVIEDDDPTPVSAVPTSGVPNTMAAPAAGAFLGDSDLTSANNAGIGNGNQTFTPLQTVTNISGNAVGVLGNAQAASTSGSTSFARSRMAAPGGATAWIGGADLTSSGNAGIANGTQTYAPVQTVTNVCGNAIAALGNAQAVCSSGSTASLNRSRRAADLTSANNAGIANGNQTYIPTQTVTNISGNAVGVLGNAQASSVGGATAKMKRSRMSGSDLTSSGNAGIANGNQTYAPVQTATNVSGNAVGVLGNAAASSTGGAVASQ